MLRKITIYLINTEWKLLTAIILFFFSGSAVGAGELPPDMSRIYANDQIVVAIHSEDQQPFCMHDKKGVLTGLDIELAHDIGSKLGLNIIFKNEAKTFDDVVEMVAEKRADIAIACISRTLKRAVKVNFTTPYIKLHHGFIISRLKTASKAGGNKNIEWLNNKNIQIGTIERSAYVQFARDDYPMARLIVYKKWGDIVSEVLNGNIDAGFYDDNQIIRWIKNHPEKMLYLESKILKAKEDPISMAVHWEDMHLLGWLNQYIDTIASDGTLDRLKKKYLSD